MPADGAPGDNYWGLPPPPQVYLLEVTVISAQDLHRRLGRRVRAYAVAWVDGAHRLRTEVDRGGGCDPTWNDRFVFRVNAGFLRSETAAVTVEVRDRRRLGADGVLGRTGIVVSTFVRPSNLPAHGFTGRLVAALQLRHPRTLEPRGIVNVAVAVMDAAHAPTVPVPIYGTPDSPDAFSVKDLTLMMMKRPASLGNVANFVETQPASLVEHSGPLDSKGAALEQSKLELTLKKWKDDMSPEVQREGSRLRPRRRRSLGSCFGGGEDWER